MKCSPAEINGPPSARSDINRRPGDSCFTERRTMKASILIVGQYDVLTHTRAQLLAEWEAFPVDLNEAWAAINARQYDLIIFCQTISDNQALQLMARAALKNPNLKALAICQPEHPRGVELNQFRVELAHPNHLREAVAALLS
jgi:hypothetical protein